MIYLNDVEEGGETAFPIADEEDLETKVRNTKMFFMVQATISLVYT